jgi:hypothetical protein
MNRCAMHECDREGTKPYVILGKRFLSKRSRVLVETVVCDVHNAAIEQSGSTAYVDPPGVIYLNQPSSPGR